MARLRDSYTYAEAFQVRDNPTPEALLTRLSDAALAELVINGQVAESIELSSGRGLRVLGELGELRVVDPSAVTSPTPGIRRFGAAMFVGIPAASVADTLARLARDLGLTVVLAFVAFGAGVFLLSRQVLAPVKRVTSAAGRITGRDLSRRVPVPRSQDEMRELAVTINHMLERLQESFETQRRFTADASHELRTPVTAIVGHTNYLLRRTRPTPEQVDSLTVIRREAERMAKLVNDLLELARADAGFAISPEPANLTEIVEAVHMEVAPMAGATEIEVHTPDKDVVVEGDPARLKQVLLNLVQNALNAGASRVSIGLRRERDHVELEVLDNGPGIPESAIPHLFDRFYRVDGARSTRGNGSGLGLAIVRWIVSQHGGQVSVESRIGEGTVFRVELPLEIGRATEAGARHTITDSMGIFRSREDPPA